MTFEFHKEELPLLSVIQECSQELSSPTYLVGGYVRDRVMGKSSKDMDIVCLGSGIALAKKVAGRLGPDTKVAYYKRFGTAMIRSGEGEIEFVGARKESYRSDSRKPMVEDGSLEDDQNRRDFTINALSVSLNKDTFGELIDPFDGLGDIKRQRIKTPLTPGQTFSDDPLRMLRAIRFASQLEFGIEEATWVAISENKHRLSIVSNERILGELERIMSHKRPSIGFKLMEESGLLDLILPELQALKGVDIKNGVAHKDNFYHTLQVLDNVCDKTDNIWLRWSALFHDIAKPATKKFIEGQGWTFHGHDAVGAYMLPKIFKRLKLPLDQKMKFVQKMVRLHLRPISLTKENITDSAIRRLLFDASDDLEDLLLLCEADITSKNPNRVKRYMQNYRLVRQRLEEVEDKDRIRNWQPPITGEIIMKTFGIKPSRLVGDIKTSIREAILEGDIANEYEEAYSFMLKCGAEHGLHPVAK